MTEDAEPTFEQLKTERAHEWATAQSQAAQSHLDLQERYLKMADVVNAPEPGDTWRYRGMVCRCGGETFTVRRYVAVNGHLHRAEVECQGCQTVGTWDRSTRAWL